MQRKKSAFCTKGDRMRTEEEIRDLIEQLEDSLHDHHLFLNEQYVIDGVLHFTDFMIKILKWVVNDDVQGSAPSTIEEKKNV